MLSAGHAKYTTNAIFEALDWITAAERRHGLRHLRPAALEIGIPNTFLVLMLSFD